MATIASVIAGVVLAVVAAVTVPAVAGNQTDNSKTDVVSYGQR